MRRSLLFPLMALLAILSGCASVPPEAVDLSRTLGQDLESAHQANRTLAELYFDNLLSQVDQFVNTAYRPYIIETTYDDLDMEAMLDEAASDSSDISVIEILSIFTEETVAQIDRFRRDLQRPIQSQRRETLGAIDRAFGQMKAANGALTDHLSSVRAVHAAQAEALEDVGLADYRAAIGQKLAGWSDQVQEVLEEAQKADEKLDELPARIEEIMGNVT